MVVRSLSTALSGPNVCTLLSNVAACVTFVGVISANCRWSTEIRILWSSLRLKLNKFDPFKIFQLWLSIIEKISKLAWTFICTLIDLWSPMKGRHANYILWSQGKCPRVLSVCPLPRKILKWGWKHMDINGHVIPKQGKNTNFYLDLLLQSQKQQYFLSSCWIWYYLP